MRQAVYGPVPAFLFEAAVGRYLQGTFGNAQGLWRHQAHAIERLAEGRNVVISTGTASGKSLVFRSHAVHRILRDPEVRVLVFYPLKALASDQLRGWRARVTTEGA